MAGASPSQRFHVETRRINTKTSRRANITTLYHDYFSTRRQPQARDVMSISSFRHAHGAAIFPDAAVYRGEKEIGGVEFGAGLMQCVGFQDSTTVKRCRVCAGFWLFAAADFF